MKEDKLHWDYNKEQTEKQVEIVGRQVAELVEKQKYEMEHLLNRSLGNFSGPKFTFRKLEAWGDSSKLRD